jgi:D-lyxose ketol-isomerase
MKRSEINAIIRDAEAFLKGHHFHLPPFAYWSPQDWLAKGSEVAEIVERQLGWDITDFGLGDYAHTGLFIFTIRNGDPENLKRGAGKVYAEKVLIVDVDQVTPLHFHWRKVEDIINRGGGVLAIQLFNSTDEDALSESAVVVSLDGIEHVLKAGDTVFLRPGESITLPTRMYHKFWGVERKVLVGEVSVVNDDKTDNRFYEPVGRFPSIEEDVEPLYLLCTDYPRYHRKGLPAEVNQ